MTTTSLARVASRAGSPLNPHPLNDPDKAEALAFGYGIPAEPVLTSADLPHPPPEARFAK